MSKVNDLITEVLHREGGATYTNNPSDSGGPTKFGITQATLSKWRNRSVTADDVKNLSEKEARQIYLARYWYVPGFNHVAPISPAIADELMDTGVNMGPARAVEFLQRILNAFNNRGQFYPDLAVDGKLGPQSMAALRAYLSRRGKTGEQVLLFTLDALQAERYIAIAERREKDEAFVYGQIRQRAALHWIA